MSRALLRVTNVLQCDCAAASSSKRTLSTLPVTRSLAATRVSLGCPARPTAARSVHTQHPYAWATPGSDGAAGSGGPYVWNQEHWQWYWRQRAAAHGGTDAQSHPCVGRSGFARGQTHCSSCTCHLSHGASTAQHSASMSAQHSASLSAQRTSSSSASSSVQHSASSSSAEQLDRQESFDYHAFWHRRHHPWAFHAHLTRRWLFLTGRLIFGSAFRLFFWPLCRWRMHSWHRRAWMHWQSTLDSSQRSSAHTWHHRRPPWNDHWRTYAHHHQHWNPHTQWQTHTHERPSHCFSSAIRRVWAGAGRLFPIGLRLFGTSPFARGALEYSPFASRMGHACPRGKGSCPGSGPRFSRGRRACGGCPYAEGNSSTVNPQFYSLFKCSATALGSCVATGSDLNTDISGRRFYSMHVRIEHVSSGAPAPVRMTTLSISTRMPPIRRPPVLDLNNCQHHPQRAQQRQFHATCRCEAPPLFIWLAGFLKSSAALGFVQTITRIAMTLLPVTFLKLKIASKLLKKVDEPVKREKFARHIVISRKLIIALFVVPASLFFSALLASLERTPLTGRWRMILMSPQEEDDVSKQLQGTGWYNAVADILLSNSEGKMPKVIPVTDWRYRWVDDTLRKLESYLPVFRNEAAFGEDLLKRAPPDFPTPPPSRFPLVPRPRISQMLHCLFFEGSSSTSTGGSAQKEHETTDAPHSVVGTPFNLLLVEKPDTSNGFSYGFGGGGAAGIVVFSGFLDEILKSTPPAPPAAPADSSNSWGSFLGIGSSQQPRMRDPVPTAEQTALLAVLLAHEISHLMLAHHLETLSNSTIFAPGVVGLFADVVRTLLFPITMLLGPFVNDAVANMTRASRTTILEGHEACFNRKLEIEADIVSARILAYAGFDPRIAIDFWESRLPPPQSPGTTPNTGGSSGNFWRGGGRSRDTHPVREERIQRLKAELARWETERPRLRALKP